MKRTIRENINAPYSLHDMNVISFEISGDLLTMQTQSGMTRIQPSAQVDGYVEFHDVDWDFCHVYLLGTTGNTGSFSGEKMMLRDFISAYPKFGISIMDEVYGYNQTKYMGYFMANRMFGECIVEIYHLGNMVFVEK